MARIIRRCFFVRLHFHVFYETTRRYHRHNLHGSARRTFPSYVQDVAAVLMNMLFSSADERYSRMINATAVESFGARIDTQPCLYSWAMCYAVSYVPASFCDKFSNVNSITSKKVDADYIFLRGPAALPRKYCNTINHLTGTLLCKLQLKYARDMQQSCDTYIKNMQYQWERRWK